MQDPIYVSYDTTIAFNSRFSHQNVNIIKCHRFIDLKGFRYEMHQVICIFNRLVDYRINA